MAIEGNPALKIIVEIKLACEILLAVIDDVFALVQKKRVMAVV